MSELKDAPDFLVGVATELESFIDEKNAALKKAITCTDLDDPDYHDYESCFELMRLAYKIKGLEKGAN